MSTSATMIIVAPSVISPVISSLSSVIISTATSTASASSSAASLVILPSLCNVHSHGVTLHHCSIKGQRLLQAASVLKLDITESFELVSFTIVHQSHISHLQLFEDRVDITLDNVCGEIANIGCVGGLVWDGSLATTISAIPSSPATLPVD